MRKTIFLDRDGTINVEKNYLYKIEEFEFLPGVLPALAKLQRLGYQLIVITNQSGIGRGYYTEAQYHILTDWMCDTLQKQGITLTAVYHCPHHPQAVIEAYRRDCDCRKPGLGLFWQAAREWQVDWAHSYAIGDKLRDCAICKQTACRGFLIDTNESPAVLQAVQAGQEPSVRWAADLAACAAFIEQEEEMK